MSDQMNEGGVKCMGLITLLHPITTLQAETPSLSLSLFVSRGRAFKEGLQHSGTC